MRMCPFTGCNKNMPDNMFACRSHWFSLNKAEQREIHDAYDDYMAGVIDIERLRDRQQSVLGLRGSADRV
jgi:hypothetical protein